MSRLAPLVGAIALTCSFAAVAQTPAQSLAPQNLAAAPSDPTQQLRVVPDASVPAESGDLTSCGPRAEIVAQLGSVFRESQNGMGIIDQSAVVEVFVSDTGTFTILASGTDGTSCILASGEGWDGAIPVSGKGA